MSVVRQWSDLSKAVCFGGKGVTTEGGVKRKYECYVATKKGWAGRE